MMALFGGTFDPVHKAHLAMAREALRCLGLSRLILIPAGDPPHREPPGAAASHRRRMLELAVAGDPRLVIDDREMQRPGPSYFRLTLAEYRTLAGPREPLVMVLGEDAAAGLGRWNGAGELSALAHLLVLARPEHRLDAGLPRRLGWQEASSIEALREAPCGLWHLHRGPLLALSASAVRAALGARDAKVAEWLPAPVLAYIREHGLYRPAVSA